MTSQYLPDQPEILNLHDPRDVARSAGLARPVLWVSPVPPERLAGPLVADFQGAWADANRIVVHLAGQTHLFPLAPHRPGDVTPLARAVLEQVLAGTPQPEITASLSTAASLPAVA